ncbi:hypothetical protein ACFSHR_02765 [Azotobacter chroococcum]
MQAAQQLVQLRGGAGPGSFAYEGDRIVQPVGQDQFLHLVLKRDEIRNASRVLAGSGLSEQQGHLQAPEDLRRGDMVFEGFAQQVLCKRLLAGTGQLAQGVGQSLERAIGTGLVQAGFESGKTVGASDAPQTLDERFVLQTGIPMRWGRQTDVVREKPRTIPRRPRPSGFQAHSF